jgi:hypothetical protein
MQPKADGRRIMKPNEIHRLLERLAKREDSDIYLFNAGIWDEQVDKFRSVVCGKTPKRANAIVFLTTLGGNPDAAYRMGACLQRHYANIAFYIFGPCKSAGTLAALAAKSIVLGDFGELGPLDVQLVKPDEIIPTSSGLDIFQALAVITNSAFEAFERYFLNLVERSQGSISTKTGAEIASGLAVGLFGPMTAQIDPERLGEVQRAINIANAYGSRLDKGNLKANALEKLVQGYPTHGFVIDLDEAKTIFRQVRNADQLERRIGTNIPFVRRVAKDAVVFDLLTMFAAQTSKKGKTNGTKPKAKTAAKTKAKSSPGTTQASSGANPGNVAQLRRDAARNATPSEKNDDATSRSERRSTKSRR